MPTFSTLNERLPAPAPAPAVPVLPDPPSTSAPEATVPALPASVLQHVCMSAPPSAPPVRPTHACIPSHIVHNLQSGVGISSMHPSDPIIPRGIAIPGSFTEEDEVNNLIGSTWDEDDVPDLEDDDISGLEEDCDSLKQIFIAETTDLEALEPCTLGEACHCPDWAQWE
jgi:hypothetical protein